MKIKNLFPFVFIITIGFIPLLNLFNTGFPVTHDGQDHIARIANFYQNLTNGNIIPRWAPNLNWGYGHPILMFLYPVPSYISSLFHFLGFTFTDSLKITFGITFILSAVAMFLWVRNLLNDFLGVVAAVLYLFAPYRFVDLYVRGAIGEHVAFIFPPLILYFLLMLSKKYSPWYVFGGAMSLAGLILSHNAISLMFMPLIIFYAIYLFLSQSKKYLIHNICLIMLLGFGIASFFWIPAFFEGKYTLRNIVTAGGYENHFIKPFDLIYGKWNYGGSGQFTVQIGIIHLLFLLASLSLLMMSVIHYKSVRKNMYLVMFLVLYTLIAIFLMLPYSNFIWQKFMILQNFQFPWRFLSVIVFTSSILSALLLKMLPTKLQTILGFILIIFSIFLSKDYWHAQNYKQKNEKFFTSTYYSTTDTGESSPVWSIRFMGEIPKSTMEVIDGSAEIKELKRESTVHKYKIVANTKTRIRENTLYFPGWEVYINNKRTNVEFQDPENRGLITFYVDKGINKAEVLFKNTKLRTFSELLTIISLGVMCLMFFKLVLFKR